MGLLTLAQMEEEVRLSVGGRSSSDPALTTTRIDRYLDWAQLHVARPSIFPHRELETNGTFTLSTDTQSYAFTSLRSATTASDVVGIKHVVNQTRGRRLPPRGIRQLDEISRDSAGNLRTGQPEIYAVDGTSFWFYPTPSSTYNGDTILVRHWLEPVPLASSGAASVLSPDWDEVIVLGAVWRSWRALGQLDRAEIHKAEFGQLINEITDRLKVDSLDQGWQFDVSNIQHMQEHG